MAQAKFEITYKSLTHALLLAILYLTNEVYVGQRKVIEEVRRTVQDHEVRIVILENKQPKVERGKRGNASDN